MKAKVLLIQQVIPSYRIPIFNLLAESVDLTVVYDPAPCRKVRGCSKKVSLFTFRRGQGLSRRLRRCRGDIRGHNATRRRLRCAPTGRLKRAGSGLFTGASAFQRAIPRATTRTIKTSAFTTAFARVRRVSVFTATIRRRNTPRRAGRARGYLPPEYGACATGQYPRKKDTLLFLVRSIRKRDLKNCWNNTNCLPDGKRGRSAPCYHRGRLRARAHRGMPAGARWPNAWNSPRDI